MSRAVALCDESIDSLVQAVEFALSELYTVPLLVKSLREAPKDPDVNMGAWNALLDILQVWDISEDMSRPFRALAKNMDHDLFLCTCAWMEQAITDIVDSCESF